MSRFIDTNQFAARLGCTKRTLFRWLRDGKIPKPAKDWGWLKWDEAQIENSGAIFQTRKPKKNNAKQ